MKRLDFIKELKELGATFGEGSKHQKVYLNGKQSTIPRHNEIKNFTAKEIRKQLGIMWLLYIPLGISLQWDVIPHWYSDLIKYLIIIIEWHYRWTVQGSSVESLNNNKPRIMSSGSFFVRMNIFIYKFLKKY